jgi:hypothetical protein
VPKSDRLNRTKQAHFGLPVRPPSHALGRTFPEMAKPGYRGVHAHRLARGGLRSALRPAVLGHPAEARLGWARREAGVPGTSLPESVSMRPHRSVSVARQYQTSHASGETTTFQKAKLHHCA